MLLLLLLFFWLNKRSLFVLHMKKFKGWFSNPTMS